MFFNNQTVFSLIIIIVSLICLLIIIAFYTVAERKMMASIQRRQGPHKVGFLGLLQAFADALKLVVKKTIIQLNAGKFLFMCAPWIILALSLLSWEVIPLTSNSFIANMTYSINFVLAMSSLNVYCMIIAGWSSNSKYSFFGAMRSAAQMISYEVVISVLILNMLLFSNSLNFVWMNLLQYKNVYFMLPLIIIFIIFLVIILAETNSTPFDLPEAEAELVAGYNLEYSSIIFALFFLAEYANMLLMSVMTLLFFFSYNFTLPHLTKLARLVITTILYGMYWFYWMWKHMVMTNTPSPQKKIMHKSYMKEMFLTYFTYPFMMMYSPRILYALGKSLHFFMIILICIYFMIIRATLPRYSYDHLLLITWKGLMPLTFSILIILFALIFVY